MSTVISILLLVTYCITFIASVNEKFGKSHCDFTVESNHYTCNDDSSCTTWFYCNTETSRCQCGGYHGMIVCDEATGRAAVSECHWVTYNNVTKETLVGSCYYNCENNVHKALYDRVYHTLPKNLTEPKFNAKNLWTIQQSRDTMWSMCTWAQSFCLFIQSELR